MIEKYDYIIYIDGSYRSSRKQGGYAVVIYNSEYKLLKVLLKGIKYTTNNRMELSALISALKFLPENSFSKIVSDSEYVIKPILYKWLEKWEACNFEDKKNPDLWKQVIKLLSTKNLSIDFEWVKGHNTDEYNNFTDQLAQHASMILLNNE